MTDPSPSGPDEQRSEDLCYLCGEALGSERTKDHVPPSQLFAPEIRQVHNLDSLVTLPTHPGWFTGCWRATYLWVIGGWEGVLHRKRSGWATREWPGGIELLALQLYACSSGLLTRPRTSFSTTLPTNLH